MNEKTEELIAEARKCAPGDDATELAVIVRDLADALEAATALEACRNDTESGTVLASSGGQFRGGLVGRLDEAAHDAEVERATLEAAARAAQGAPQGPKQNETKSGQDFVSLDPEKVADLIEQMRDRSRKERDVAKESLGRFIARALCEAAKRGELS